MLNRLSLLVAGMVLSAAPAFAQVDVVIAAKAELLAQGKNLSGACGAILITNLVAQRTHMGLLRKAGGNRAALLADGTCLNGDETRAPGYATDYLIDRNTFYGTDILADGGGANGPQWSAPETAADMVARNRVNFSEPVYLTPVVVVVPPVVPPVPDPVVVPVPPVVVVPPPAPLPSTDITAQLTRIEAQILACRADIAEFRAAVRSKWEKFWGSSVTKYALAVVAGIAAKWGMSSHAAP